MDHLWGDSGCLLPTTFVLQVTAELPKLLADFYTLSIFNVYRERILARVLEQIHLGALLLFARLRCRFFTIPSNTSHLIQVSRQKLESSVVIPSGDSRL